VELPVLTVILNVLLVQQQQILLNVVHVLMEITYLALLVLPVIQNVKLVQQQVLLHVLYVLMTTSLIQWVI
jgi:hypothetical protein